MTAQTAGFPLLVLPGSAVMAWTDQQVIYSGDLVRLTDHDPKIDKRREAMIDWLAKHGIDANHVPVPGWIVRDETHRCVVYWGSHDCVTASNTRPCYEGECERVMVEPLEAPPLPFPMREGKSPWQPNWIRESL